MLKNVEWGEFRLGDLFEVYSSKYKFDANKVNVLQYGKYPYIVRLGSNNGQKGFIDKDEKYLNEGNTITFGQDTATLFYQEHPYFTGDKIKVLKAKSVRFNKENAHFFITAMMKPFSSFSWGKQSFNEQTIRDQKIKLPINSKGEINFDFIEKFIATLKAERLATLKAERLATLKAYLQASGLTDTQLTDEERKVLEEYKSWKWSAFNLEKLFGKSTRGKRLKSEDRIAGTLPFVTAGEAEEGVSAFIGNNVEVFSANTTTIDMFGSAKYRNYKYGADDHVAVVHTERLPKHAAIFITSAIHKSSHNGQFSYSNNFYASDADVLDIHLPVKNSTPDYKSMSVLISAIEKLVIKDVVRLADENIEATEKVINNGGKPIETYYPFAVLGTAKESDK